LSITTNTTIISGKIQTDNKYVGQVSLKKQLKNTDSRAVW